MDRQTTDSSLSPKSALAPLPSRPPVLLQTPARVVTVPWPSHLAQAGVAGVGHDEHPQRVDAQGRGAVQQCGAQRAVARAVTAVLTRQHLPYPWGIRVAARKSYSVQER